MTPQAGLARLPGRFRALQAPRDAPLLTAATAVCRSRLPAAGGALPHVVVLVDAFLDVFSCRSDALAVACERGASTRELSYLLAREPHAFQKKVVRAAATGGHVHVLRWLAEHEHASWEPQNWRVMSCAAANGHLDVVRWLHAHELDIGAMGAMDVAARNGHLQVVQWLYANRSEGCSVAAKVGAAMEGHLEVVQWLHANVSQFTRGGMFHSLAPADYRAVMAWMRGHGREDVATGLSIFAAAYCGHLKVVQWLHQYANDEYVGQAFITAAGKGHLQVVRWLYENSRVVQEDRVHVRTALRFATIAGHENVARWLERRRPKRRRFL